MAPARRRIGILTAGGDCPGLNAVIRSVVKTAIGGHGLEVVGIKDGFEGLVENRHRRLEWSDVSGILSSGGTILGSSNRAEPFSYPTKTERGIENRDRSGDALRTVDRLGLECVVCVGGNGTMTGAMRFAQLGLNVVGVPKTIDNDVEGNEITPGFDTAVATATDAIDRIHTTAQSHHRVMVIEVMGRDAGWLALCSGLAGGADVILLPELPYDPEVVARTVTRRSSRGSRFSIVVVGEGARPQGGDVTVQKDVPGLPGRVRLGGVGQKVAEDIEETTGIESRVTVLGHLLRGGTPTSRDRLLGTLLGVRAAHLAAERQYRIMVACQGGEVVTVELEKVGGRTRTVPLDSPLLAAARAVGTCLGTEEA
jgi:phosphofructokinase-like protein